MNDRMHALREEAREPVKRVVVVESSGQGGRLLHERLLEEGCDVIGITRSSPGVNILDAAEVFDLVRGAQPREVYYLAAFHHSSQDQIALGSVALFQRSLDVHVTGFPKLFGRREKGFLWNTVILRGLVAHLRCAEGNATERAYPV